MHIRPRAYVAAAALVLTLALLSNLGFGLAFDLFDLDHFDWH